MAAAGSSIASIFLGVRADSSRLSGDLKKAIGKINSSGKKVAALGSDLSAKVTLPVVAMGAGILKVAGDFESSMNRVSAITGATGTEFEELRGLARELGSTTQFSASEAAEGIAFLGQAGFEANEIMTALPATLTLAAAGSIELGQAADIASNVLGQFQLKADETQRVVDVLAKAASSANTDVSQMAQALSFAGPVAASLGVSIEETAAAIGVLGDSGIQATRAGTAIRGIAASFLTLDKKKSVEVLQELGLSAEDLDIKTVGLTGAIEKLKKAQITETQVVKLFGKEQFSAFQILQNGTKDVRSLTGELQNAGGAAQTMADANMAGLNGQLKGLKSAVEELFLAIADTGLLDKVTSLVTRFANFTREIAKTNPELLALGVAVAGAATALGPLLFVAGKLITVFAALKGSILAAGGLKAAFVALATGPVAFVAAAGSVIAILGKIGIEFKKTVDATGSVKEALLLVADAFENSLGTAIDFWVGLFNKAKNTFTDFVRSIGAKVLSLKETFGGVWDAIVDVAERKLRKFVLIVQKKLAEVENKFLDLGTELVFNSIVPDMMDAIIDQAKRMKDFVQPFSDGTKKVETDFSKTSKKLTTQTELNTKAFEDMGASMVDSIDKGSKGFIDFGKTALDAIDKIFNASKKGGPINIGNFGIGNQNKGSGGFLSGIGSIISGFFADGGRPPVGQAAVVGERGPELFVPDRPGTIVPNNQLSSAGKSGGVTIQQNITFEGNVDESRMSVFAQRIKQQTLDSLIDQMQRGGALRSAMQS